jgi:hypothetical protein
MFYGISRTFMKSESRCHTRGGLEEGAEKSVLFLTIYARHVGTREIASWR